MKLRCRQRFSGLLLFTMLLTLFSCNNRAIMFKTGIKYDFDELGELPEIKQYKIAINDELNILVIPNNGAMLLERDQSSRADESIISGTKTTVEYDGTLKLPVLGSVLIKDLTVREAELMLEERYRAYFIDPFVKITVTNKRIILFPGNSGSARVITLKNQNTTLIEALALGGGISANGKSSRVKLIRKDLNGVSKVYKIDLEHIDGVEPSQLVLQGNDIVYVEPRNDYLLNFAQRASSYFFILNLLLIVNTLVQ